MQSKRNLQGKKKTLLLQSRIKRLESELQNKNRQRIKPRPKGDIYRPYSFENKRMRDRKKSRNVRNRNKMRDMVVERPINKPDGIDGVQNIKFKENMKYINPSKYTLMVPQVPSIQVQKWFVPINTSSFTSVASISALIAMSMGISVDDTFTTLGNQVVGTLYFYATAIAYDLYNAADGGISMFNDAPRWYWDIRSAITPVTRGNTAYQFTVAETFIGNSDSMYPNGFPIILNDRGTVTLGWSINNTTPQTILQSTPVVVTVADILEAGSDVTNTIWTQMAKLSEACVLEENPGNNNYYTKMVGAFAAYIPMSTIDGVNDRWSSFYIETPVNPEEKWLAMLGLANFAEGVDELGELQTRTGFFTWTDFQTTDYLGDRILCGHYGKTPEVRLRKKVVALEHFAAFITTQLMAGEMFYNEVAGTNDIKNSMFTSPILINLPASYLVCALMSILRRWQLLNACYFSNPDTLALSLAGRKFYVGNASTTELTTTCLKETLADLIPNDMGKDSNGVFKTVVMIGAFGNFSMDPTNSGNGSVEFYDLINLVDILYPSASATSYTLNPDNFGMFPYVDIFTTNIANFTGVQVPLAEQSVTMVYDVLQNNIGSSIASANINLSTLTHYTQRWVMVQEGKEHSVVERVKKREKRLSKGCVDSGGPPIPQWTLFYNAYLDQLMNKFSFSNNNISYDLSRIMPVTFNAAQWWAAVYKENYSMRFDINELKIFQAFISNGAKVFAHPNTTIGGVESDTMLQEAVKQDRGGGFSLGKMLGGLAGMIPGIGPIAAPLLESLLGGDE